MPLFPAPARKSTVQVQFPLCGYLWLSCPDASRMRARGAANASSEILGCNPAHAFLKFRAAGAVSGTAGAERSPLQETDPTISDVASTGALNRMPRVSDAVVPSLNPWLR
ncbi:hypothetical protein VTK56DRAFT_7520 [Thermocarpiscus australiensis]